MMNTHPSDEEHAKSCPSCARRIEYMKRLGVEVQVLAFELGLGKREAIDTLIDLAINMAHQNDMMEDLIEHMCNAMRAATAEWH